MAAKTTYDFDMMLSNAREAYGEELYKMACEGKDFVFTFSDNVAPSSSAGKLLKEFPERCFNFGIAEPCLLYTSFDHSGRRSARNRTRYL